MPKKTESSPPSDNEPAPPPRKNSIKKEKNDASEKNLKLINTTSGVRVSQACDRCRIKKIKCDGLTPCHNCEKTGFKCETSDKLSRRAFPKGYTENLEQKLKAMQDENRDLKLKLGIPLDSSADGVGHSQSPKVSSQRPSTDQALVKNENVSINDNESKKQPPNKVTVTTNENTTLQINNPIDQIFNLDDKGIVIGNDNLNFESQFNHLLISLNLPFLKITNSHNFLLNDPDSYLYHPSYTMYNQFHNRDLEVIYNPLTVNNYLQHTDILGNMSHLTNNELPRDVYDLFIKLIGNFKKMFNNKHELDCQIVHFFINYNTFIPVFDYKRFMESYDAFHTMYPFMFTYDDATINGFNISNNDYHVVNEYLMVVIQIYAMIMMNDPTINLNLLLNHPTPNFSFSKKVKNDARRSNDSIIRSLYDFLPYFNVFHVSINQLQTYLLFLYYSLLTNNKEKSLVLSSLINAFIGILGINLNAKNLFFNDLSLTLQQKRDRVKIFWSFKILLKCFNLKFGFKPSLNTTVINPVTIDRYFELTPAKLSSLLEISPEESNGGATDELFKTLLSPSVEFLNLVNIILPSSFSPNYYQYLKSDREGDRDGGKKATNDKHLDWILNDDDGDGNDGNLNFNFTQFLTIDKNLSNWRYSLKDRHINLLPLSTQMNLPRLSSISTGNLHHNITINNNLSNSGITEEGLLNYLNTGLPDILTASQLVKIQLNFHYLLIRSMNYLNFVVDRELTQNYYVKISNISREVLAYFNLIFEHVGRSVDSWEDDSGNLNVTSSTSNGSNVGNFSNRSGANRVIMESLGLNVDEDGFVINDFSVKRRKTDSIFGGGGFDSMPTTTQQQHQTRRVRKQIPPSPFNYMLNGLSMTIINLKKSIILQMLYLLICSLKIFKKGGLLVNDSVEMLNKSVDLFIKVFINYHIPLSPRNRNTPKGKEDELFLKLINDEAVEEILREPHHHGDDSDDEGDDEGDLGIDWDDEDMDEDLKYLKILKFIKYKINTLQASSAASSTRTKSNGTTDYPRSNGGSGQQDTATIRSEIPPPAHVTHYHHHHHHHVDNTDGAASRSNSSSASVEAAPNADQNGGGNSNHHQRTGSNDYHGQVPTVNSHNNNVHHPTTLQPSLHQQHHPPPPSIHNFYGPLPPPPPSMTNLPKTPAGPGSQMSMAGSPPAFPGMMAKVPSMSRFDFLLGDEANFPNSGVSPNASFNYSSNNRLSTGGGSMPPLPMPSSTMGSPSAHRISNVSLPVSSTSPAANKTIVSQHEEHSAVGELMNLKHARHGDGPSPWAGHSANYNGPGESYIAARGSPANTSGSPVNPENESASEALAADKNM